MALSPRGIREDEEMTERFVQKLVLPSSSPYDDF